MPDFATVGPITLQPDDIGGYSFKNTVESAAGANDGWLPFGVNVSSIVLTVWNNAFTSDITSDIVSGTPQVVDNIISVVFKYPATNKKGTYKAKFKCTLSNGKVKTCRFYRIYAIGEDD